VAIIIVIVGVAIIVICSRSSNNSSMNSNSSSNNNNPGAKRVAVAEAVAEGPVKCRKGSLNRQVRENAHRTGRRKGRRIGSSKWAVS
jgi:hypothetical protein